jgi:hypothetical protein
MTQTDHLSAPLCAAIANELRAIRALIERLAETLVSDEAFATAHMVELQLFDLVIQRTDESADLLDRMAAGSKTLDAIAKVRLSVVQEGLRSALSLAA